ncbi:hypothetical protein Tco_1317900, partial [Tanacetum coccineum]
MKIARRCSLRSSPENLETPTNFSSRVVFRSWMSALVDLGASINPMPLSVWKKLSLSKLTPNHMTLELTNRSVAIPFGVSEDVFVNVGKFYFPADFVVVDYDVDPRDNFEEVLKIKKLSHHLSSSTTSTPDSSPSLTPVETSDYLLEEFADELALLDPFPPGIGDADFDPKGDILLLEKLLNNDPSSPLPSKELNFEELKTIKSSIDDFTPLDVLRGNSVIFSNPLSISNEDFTSSDNEPPPEQRKSSFYGVLEDIESEDSYVSNLDEPDFLVTPLSNANDDKCFGPGGEIDEIDAFLDMDISTDIKNGYHDSEGDIIYLESLIIDDTIPNLPPEVFLDHDRRSLKDELDNNDLKTMVKVFDPDIFAYSFYSLEPVAYEKICSSTCFVPNITMIWGDLDPFIEIPSGESKVHIEVLSMLWGNRLPILDCSAT